MKGSEGNTFSVDEVCRIIDACASRGVREISLGALKLEFSPALKPSIDFDTPQKEQFPEPDHAQNDQDSLVQDEVRAKEEQIQMLILEDPQEFERQLAAGELEEMISDAGSNGSE